MRDLDLILQYGRPWTERTVLYKEKNLYNCADKVVYDSIYSEKEDESMQIVKKILELWDLGNGRNCMRTA